MLEIDSVNQSFGDFSVLAGCYLNCSAGEIVGLLGRNGSGKSTLLKIIFGSQNAKFMHLQIDDKVIRQGYKKGIAYLPQQSFLPPFFKVREIMEQVDPGLLNSEIGDIFNKTENSLLRSLSGGELKILECLWILSRPAPYILLDEPFSGVSPLHILILQKAITKAAEQKGIILTDHLYRPLLEISSRIVLLHNKAVYRIDNESDLIRYNYIPDFSCNRYLYIRQMPLPTSFSEETRLLFVRSMNGSQTTSCKK